MSDSEFESQEEIEIFFFYRSAMIAWGSASLLLGAYWDSFQVVNAAGGLS
jgi:hypothetical protein